MPMIPDFNNRLIITYIHAGARPMVTQPAGVTHITTAPVSGAPMKASRVDAAMRTGAAVKAMETMVNVTQNAAVNMFTEVSAA